MATVYPLGIDNSATLPKVVNNITSLTADVINQLRDAIISVEAELGVKPSGTYGTVRERLDFIDKLIYNLQTTGVIFAGDLYSSGFSQTVIGIQNHPISATPPVIGQVLSYNGTNWAPSSLSFSGDLSGTLTSQTVIRIQNTPVSSTPPTLNQFLQYDGSSWTPSDFTSQFSVGDGYQYLYISSGTFSNIGTGSNTFMRIGSVVVNAADYPIGTTFKFEVIFEATAGQTAEIRLYNITDGYVVSGSTLTTTSSYSDYKTVLVSLPAYNAKYETQIRIQNVSPAANDGVLCSMSRIKVYAADATITPVNLLNFTVVTSNYIALTTDYIISVGTLASSITITLPASPATGKSYIIKDANGSASAYNIIINGNGKLIDTISTYTISTNYSAVNLVYNGTKWMIV